MIVYHHNNIHCKMILLIWYVVIENSPDIEHIDIVVNKDDTSALHDDSGNPFLTVLSYKDYISCTKHDNSVTKNDYRWFVYDYLFISFLILISSINCL